MINIESTWFQGKDDTCIIISGSKDDETITVPGANCYMLELEDFMDAVINNRPPRLNAYHAVKNMAAIDKLYKYLQN